MYAERTTRFTDNSAKYQVCVHAKDSSMPEGLKRMLDVLAEALSPVEDKVEASDAASDAGDTGDTNV